MVNESTRGQPELALDRRTATISVNSLTLRVILASLHAKTIGDEVEPRPSVSAADHHGIGESGASMERWSGVRLSDAPLPLAACADDERGPLAQLAEQLTLNQQVRGSSPWRLTNIRRVSDLTDRRRLSSDSAAPTAATSHIGEVSELADEHDLGSCAARRRSSSLLFPTSVRQISVLTNVPITSEPQASLKEISYG